MQSLHRWVVVGMAVGLAGVTGCGHQPEPVSTPPVATPTTRPTGQGDVSPPAPAADPDAETRNRRTAVERARAVLAEMVFFDFDQSELRPEAKAALDRKRAVLEHSPGVRLRIAGHADERGSDEYNLALGMRRAAAARRYLVQNGVAQNRLEAVSFGEERPLAQGHDEAAWGRNRRAEFEVTVGDVLP